MSDTKTVPFCPSYTLLGSERNFICLISTSMKNHISGKTFILFSYIMLQTPAEVLVLHCNNFFQTISRLLDLLLTDIMWAILTNAM